MTRLAVFALAGIAAAASARTAVHATRVIESGRVERPGLRHHGGELLEPDGVGGRIVGHVGWARCAPVDADGDGQVELLTGGNDGWAVLEYEPARRDFRARHVHALGHGRVPEGPIVQVGAHEVTGDAREDVLVMLDDGRFRVHDAGTGEMLMERQLELSGTPKAFAVADRGLAATLLVVGDAGLDVFLLAAPGRAWGLPGSDGVDVRVANMDADAALEAVVARGDDVPGHVIDLDTRSIEWVNPDGFGEHVACGDIDGDGIADVFAANRWGRYAAHAPGRQETLWSGTTLDTFEVAVADIDGDGDLEVLRAPVQDSTLTVLDNATGAVAHAFAAPGTSRSGFNGLAIGDFDHDCHPDVALVQDSGNTGENVLSLLDPGREIWTWLSTGLEGSPRGVGAADVDGDGALELLVLDGQHEGNDLVLRLHDLPALQERWSAAAGDTAGVLTWGQLDADPQLEILVAATQAGAAVRAFDGSTGAIEWSWFTMGLDAVVSAACHDFDGDGLDEVVLSTADYSAPNFPPAVVVLPPDGATESWRSPRFAGGDEITAVLAHDIDGDGAAEIVALSRLEGLVAWDGLTHVEERRIGLTGGGCLLLTDIDGDGDLDAVAGLDAGGIEARDMVTGLATLASGADRVFALRREDVDADGRDELLSLEGPPGTMSLRVRALAGDLLWESDPMPGGPGWPFRHREPSLLAFGDVDHDGREEAVVATSGSVAIFEHGDADADAEPPAFAGIASLSVVPSPACCPAIDVAWTAGIDAAHPPVEYDVFRSETPGFAPDASSWITRVGGLSYRDGNVAADTTQHYVVRAVDARGNSTTNDVQATLRAMTTWPPEAPVTSASDAHPCAPDGVEIVFTHSGIPAGTTYDLAMDGVTIERSVTSPWLALPPDGRSHSWAIAAVHPTCRVSTESVSVAASDLAGGSAAPTVDAVEDQDPCATGAVSVRFSHRDGAGFDGRFDLLVDGVVAASGVASPAAHVPGDELPHAYRIRAASRLCGTVVSDAVIATERRRPPTPPAVALVDPDTCARGGAVVRFTPGDPSSRLDLHRDGTLLAAAVVDGAVIRVDDARPHDYALVAVDPSCGASTAGPSTRHADRPAPPSPASAPAFEDAVPCALSAVTLRLTHAGFPEGGELELWRDGARFLSPVEDGTTFWPGSGGASWHLVARTSCGETAVGDSVTWAQGTGEAVAPLLSGARDADRCAASGVVLDFVPATFPSGEGRHEAWIDGALALADVRSGDVVPAPDAAPHSYAVRAVDAACAFDSTSNTLVVLDEDATCAVGRATLRVRRAGADEHELEWTRAEDAARYDAYVGTIASVRNGVYDHVPSFAGVAFPDAPVPSSGCDVASGPGTTARASVSTRESLYFLVVPFGLDGAAGSHGLRSIAPIERRDADPRPPATFCP